MHCKVAGCRYSQYHTTSYHQCGTCEKFGHGQRECKRVDLIQNLKQYYQDKLPQHMYCQVVNCKEKSTHTSCAHICRYCHKFAHQNHLKQCPNNPNFTGELINNPDSAGLDPRQDKFIMTIQPGQYTFTYGGMGCTWYIRNNSGTIQYLFMHSDSWGQYGDDSSDVPIYNAFIDGYNEIKNPQY